MASSQHTLGKYGLIAELGHGGMADVYLAMVGGPTGSGFTKLAVVKRLRPNLVEDPEFVAMLVDEARISARLNHPNVVQMIEVGVDAGEYFLAMEFLEGQPLHRIQRRASKAELTFPRDLAYVVIADVLAGLHHAHQLADYDGTPLGIVHRDVTPQNVFVTYDGTVKVVDFGIAKAAGRSSETKQGVVKGKVRYMSPEQAVGAEIDRRCDVFAVGVLLWEAATGQRFWGARDELEIIHSLIAGTFDPSPRSVAPSVPLEIDAMCRRALSVDVADRYATAAELHDDLEAFLADQLVRARKRLGNFVQQLFECERAELRQVIERASRLERETPSVTRFMSTTQPSDARSVVSATTGSLAPVGLSPCPPPPLRPRRRWRATAVVGASLLFAASLVLFSQRPGPVPSVSAAARHALQEERSELVFVPSSKKTRAQHEAGAAVVSHSTSFSAPAQLSAAATPSTPRPRSGPEAPRTEGPARRARPAIDTSDPWAASPN